MSGDLGGNAPGPVGAASPSGPGAVTIQRPRTEAPHVQGRLKSSACATSIPATDCQTFEPNSVDTTKMVGISHTVDTTMLKTLCISLHLIIFCSVTSMTINKDMGLNTKEPTFSVWLPYEPRKLSQRCFLNCWSPDTQKRLDTGGLIAIDGTPCSYGDHPSGICVQGSCVQLGCDKVRGRSISGTLRDLVGLPNSSKTFHLSDPRVSCHGGQVRGL